MGDKNQGDRRGDQTKTTAVGDKVPYNIGKRMHTELKGHQPPEAAQGTQSIDTSKTPTENGQSVIPQAAASALETAENVARNVKEVVTEAVSEAVTWVDKKAGKLSEESEEGTGPYASPATCAPSDFDVIATGVLPAMSSDELAARKDSNLKEVNSIDRSVPKEKK